MMNIFEIFALNHPAIRIGDGAPSVSNVVTCNELPAEVWGLVLGRLEQVQDFARAQLVSKTFNALVRQNCWTKIKRIHIQMVDVRLTQGRERVQLEIDTGIRGQKLVLTLDDAFLLSQKASKVESIGINFHRLFVQRRDQMLADFLDSLVATKVKIKEVKLHKLRPPQTPRMTPLALARFLSANAATIIDLEVENAFDGMRSGTPVPQLLQAFRECCAIQSVKLRFADPLVESVLQGKTQLQSLSLVCPAYCALPAMLESGAQLRHFKCYPFTLQKYVMEVYRLNRGQDHPLRTDWNLPPLPRELFPNLP